MSAIRRKQVEWANIHDYLAAKHERRAAMRAAYGAISRITEQDWDDRTESGGVVEVQVPGLNLKVSLPDLGVEGLRLVHAPTPLVERSVSNEMFVHAQQAGFRASPTDHLRVAEHLRLLDVSERWDRGLDQLHLAAVTLRDLPLPILGPPDEMARELLAQCRVAIDTMARLLNTAGPDDEKVRWLKDLPRLLEGITKVCPKEWRSWVDGEVKGMCRELAAPVSELDPHGANEQQQLTQVRAEFRKLESDLRSRAQPA